MLFFNSCTIETSNNSDIMAWHEDLLYYVNQHLYDGEYEKALYELERVRALDPSYLGFTLAEGHIYFGQKNYSLAFEKFEAALAADPDFYDYDYSKGSAVCWIGFTQYLWNQQEEALLQFQRSAAMGNEVARSCVECILRGIDLREVYPLLR